MEINPKYVGSVRDAIIAIEGYITGKNQPMAAAEIIAGILHDKVMTGIFVISTVDSAGEVIKKQATDIAAALMTEMTWNTVNDKDIWYDSDGKPEKVITNANS